jgi:hypothetical protein
MVSALDSGLHIRADLTDDKGRLIATVSLATQLLKDLSNLI